MLKVVMFYHLACLNEINPMAMMELNGSFNSLFDIIFVTFFSIMSILYAFACHYHILSMQHICSSTLVILSL